MILDRGTCKIYRKISTTPAGGKPTSRLEVIHEGYYGELNFETSPARPTEKREETRTAARIRILQNREIRNQDVAELSPFDGINVRTYTYRISRAWHGDDERTGAPISDLTLEADERNQTGTAAAPVSGTGTNAGTGTQNSGTGENAGGTGTQESGAGAQESGGNEGAGG